MPKIPPDYFKILNTLLKENPAKLTEVLATAVETKDKKYLHWDKLRFLTPPQGLTITEWWLGLKMERLSQYKSIPLKDKTGIEFKYTKADPISQRLHEIDLGIGGTVPIQEQITNSETKDQYYVNSLMDEAITSSQLEGATTTRRVAKDMIRAGRKPSDRSEQMIFNNYRTMQAIADLKKEPLTKDLVFELHRLITHDTLEIEDGAGRFRRSDEEICVGDGTEVFHIPPDANELETRMKIMCNFANQIIPNDFLHPALRAIILHFWLGYDHPFVDGNGRTARALFYWAMLRYGYWLCEYISISNIILKASAKYPRAFLYTETDDNDLTYFINYNLEVIRRAVLELQAFINMQSKKIRSLETQIKSFSLLNHRQKAIINHALRHPLAQYSIEGHKMSHKIAYQTARSDLLELSKNKLLEAIKIKKQWYFTPAANLENLLTQSSR